MRTKAIKSRAPTFLYLPLRLCLLVLFMHSGPVFATPFHVAVPAHAKHSAIDKSACVLRLKAALATQGYELQLNYTPSRRALVQASSGQIDGDLARSAMVEREYTNLRRIALPCATLKPGLYALAQASMSWQQRPLKKIAYFRGSTRLLNSLANSLSGYELVLTGSSEQGLKLLQSKRVDAVFLSKTLFAQVGKAQPELVSGIAQLTPELDDVKLYTYLHKRHEGLIVQLDRLMAVELTGLPAAP